ncbi:MAG: hypothetical protein ACQEVA_05520 [Myxococcota bacterium]
MSDYRFTIAIERETSEASDPLTSTPVSRLQRDIWDAILRHSMRYVGEYQSVWDYLRKMTTRGEREGWFQAEANALAYEFPTFHGEAPLSAAASHHWARRTAAAIHKSIQGIAEQSEASIEGGLDELRDLLARPNDLFVELRDDLWLLRVDDEPKLISDDTTLTWSDLDEAEQATVSDVRERGLCGCRMCQQMRPDESWEQRWRAALESDDIEQRRDARWFILHSTNPSIESIVAAARGTGRASLYRHLRAMNALGRRLPVERLDELSEAILDVDDETVQASLAACVAGMLLDPEQRVDVLKEMFDLPSPVAETAVEFLGYGEIPDTSRMGIAEALEERVGEGDDLNYAIALTLYNIYREDDYPPSVVKETLQQLSRQSGEAAGVAERALQWFDR